MLSKLKRYLPLLTKLIPGVQAASVWRPVVALACALVVVVNYALFPLTGHDAAELPQMFWYFFAATLGLYQFLRTGEKLSGRDPETKARQRTEAEARSMRKEVEEIRKEIREVGRTLPEDTAEAAREKLGVVTLDPAKVAEIDPIGPVPDAKGEARSGEPSAPRRTASGADGRAPGEGKNVDSAAN